MTEEEIKPAICKIIEKEDSVTFKMRIGKETYYKDVPFNNYFYILEEEYDQVAYMLSPKLLGTSIVVDYRNERYVKLVLKNNFHRNIIRNDLEDLGIKTFEADIVSGKRVLIDNSGDLDLNQENLYFAFYDIETDDRKPFVYDKGGNIVPNNPITSIALKFYKRNEENEVFYFRNTALDGEEFKEYRELRKQYYENKKNDVSNIEVVKEIERLEKELEVDTKLWEGELVLLNEFLEVAKKYDCLSSWNGRAFDDHYVRERCKYHKIDFNNLHLIGFDYMECYKKNNFSPSKSFKLDNVGYVELKSELEKEDSKVKNKQDIKKVDWRKLTGAEKYFDLFLLYPDIHKEYNIQDVNLLEMIENKLGFLKLHFVQSKIAHCLLIDTLYNSRICDIMVLNEAKKRNIIKNSAPTEIEVKQREHLVPSGGYVVVVRGFYSNVEVFDFASLYPSLGITFNISYETFIREEYPDISKVFDENECKFVLEVIKSAVKFIDKKNVLNKRKYNLHIKSLQEKFNIKNTMEELMWKFVEKYDNIINVKENECFTPSDMNYDTRGWKIHPHYIFVNDVEGIYPVIYKKCLVERNKVKYELKNIPKNTFEYVEKFFYQWGLKIQANCFSLDTQIITLDGIKNVTDIKKGDKVYSLNMKTQEIEIANVIDEIDQDHTGEMIHLKNKNTDLLVTPNHRMIYQNVITKKNKFKEAREFLGKKLVIPNNKHYMDKKLKNILDNSDIKQKNIIKEFCEPEKPTKYVTRDKISRVISNEYKRVACITLDKNNTVYAGRNDKFCWSMQSSYGNQGYRNSRDYMYELPNAITTSGRHFIKKAIIQAKNLGYNIVLTDTDSVDGLIPEGITKEDLDILFYDFYDEYLKRFNTKCNYPLVDKHIEKKIKETKDEKEKEDLEKNLIVPKHHAINLEHEKTFDKLIVVRKKRYYYKIGDKISGKGGYNVRSDVLEMTRDLQNELLIDVFNDKFDKEFWRDKLLKLKESVYNFELEEDNLIKTSGIGKNIDDYGKPIIDGKTGIQAVTKAGKPRFSNVPCYVAVAKRLIKKGENIQKNDKIQYIVFKKKPKIEAITINEYKKIRKYDADYYYEVIVRGVLEILEVICEKEVYTTFKDCWHYTDRQIANRLKKLEDIENEDEEDDE